MNSQKGGSPPKASASNHAGTEARAMVTAAPVASRRIPYFITRRPLARRLHPTARAATANQSGKSAPVR